MLYQNARNIHNYAYGVSLNSTALTVSADGQCRLELLPYLDQEEVSVLSSEAIIDGSLHRAELFDPGVTYTDIRNSLLGGRAVILVLQMCYGFFEPIQGFIETPTLEDLLDELHAVLGVGVVEMPGGQELVEFRNSWGCSWGDNGYGRIDSSYVKNFAIAARTLSVLTLDST